MDRTVGIERTARMQQARLCALAFSLVSASVLFASCAGDPPQSVAPVAPAPLAGSAVRSAPTIGAVPSMAEAASAAPATTPEVHPTGQVHWAYSGDDGPANWGALSPDYATCR